MPNSAHRMNWRIAGILLGMLLVVVFGFSLIEPWSDTTLGARTQLEAAEAGDVGGYARAIAPWDWQFPRDHGSHPDFQTEWWYYTGNLATADGRRFGYQFTIFRRAISPRQPLSDSEFRSRQIYMAHFTISDIANEDFYHDARLSRGAAGLAGAAIDPRYRVWLEDWQVAAENDDASLQRIAAAAEGFALDIRLEQVKPPALQGDRGLSPKSGEIGNASYYYSLTRLATEGTIRIGGEAFALRGHSWMDHEFSTSALGEDAQGWDWFGLIFDSGAELMVGQIRQSDGALEPAFGGLLVYPDGSARYLRSRDFVIQPTAFWVSPHTDVEYPAGWDIEIFGDDGFSFTVAPLQADQELHDSGIVYWEGAVSVDGDVRGYGYAELTGYADSMQNRF